MLDSLGVTCALIGLPVVFYREAKSGVSVITFWTCLLTVFLTIEMVLRTRRTPLGKLQLVVPFVLICSLYALVATLAITHPADLNLEMVKSKFTMANFGNCLLNILKLDFVHHLTFEAN